MCLMEALRWPSTLKIWCTHFLTHGLPLPDTHTHGVSLENSVT